jgi:hypothetical protein
LNLNCELDPLHLENLKIHRQKSFHWQRFALANRFLHGQCLSEHWFICWSFYLHNKSCNSIICSCRAHSLLFQSSEDSSKLKVMIARRKLVVEVVSSI